MERETNLPGVTQLGEEAHVCALGLDTTCRWGGRSPAARRPLPSRRVPGFLGRTSPQPR